MLFGISPLVIAERAWRHCTIGGHTSGAGRAPGPMRRHCSILYTVDIPCPAVHDAIAVVLDDLNSCTAPFGFIGPSLGYINLHPGHGKPGGHYLQRSVRSRGPNWTQVRDSDVCVFAWKCEGKKTSAP